MKIVITDILGMAAKSARSIRSLVFTSTNVRQLIFFRPNQYSPFTFPNPFSYSVHPRLKFSEPSRRLWNGHRNS